MQSDDNTEVGLLGTSQAIRAIKADVATAARSDAKVLVTGETGVGKEVVARLIHEQSARRHKPLVTLNCAGVPESLLESELFGHVRGSFTGAHKDRRGLLEMAANGTMFLDEVGEMSLRMQAVLLRFLQSGEIQRVGADSAHTRVNVRLVSATNRDLKARMADGEFREDFYFRLNVVSIHIPPLRDRAEDIPLLAAHFVEELGRQHRISTALSPELLDVLTRYRWPGNVRELRNVLERALVRARGPVLTPRDLPQQVLDDATVNSAPSAVDSATSQGARATAPSRVNDLAARMLVHGESFWAVVPPAAVLEYAHARRSQGPHPARTRTDPRQLSRPSVALQHGRRGQRTVPGLSAGTWLSFAAPQPEGDPPHRPTAHDGGQRRQELDTSL